MTDFSKMSEDELLRPDVASADPAPSADFGAMSEEELLAPDMPTGEGKTPAQMPAPKPEGRAIGFFERHGLESQAQTGVDLDETYGTLKDGWVGKTVGDVSKLLNSIAPFAGTAGRAIAGARQKSLDKEMSTGETGLFTSTESLAKEWDATEGRKYDLYQRALKGEKDVDYSPIYAKVRDSRGRLVTETDGNGNAYLDDRYAESKEDARKRFVKELAAEQTAQTTEAKANAAEDLANNTAEWYMGLAHGATASLGFAGEFYLGGALAKGVMGTQALAATRLGKAFQAAEKGAKLGFKVSAAKTAAEIAAPTLANAVARYEELTANDYGIDANGNLVLNAEADGMIRGAAKAIGGAAFENATEVALGKGVNLLVKNGIGGAFKGIYHHCPKVAKLFDGTMKAIGDARIDGAKKLWTDAVKAYAKVQNAAHFEIMPVGEFAEEYVQGYGDEVLGFGNRATEKDASLGDFTKNFFDWDAGGKDLFFGIMGQSIALGGGAYATMRGKRLVDSVNGRVIGTLKQQGYTASDIATMSAGTRLARASMEDPRIAQELGYDIIDLARMGGVREKDIEVFADNIKKMNEDGFKSLPADEQKKVKDSVNQFAEVVYGASYAFSEGMENAEELLSHLGKSMQKVVRLTEERQGLGNYKDNRTSKVEDFTSRIDWTGTVDSAGNLNWQTDESGRDYLESQPVDEDGNGVRIYREGDHFRVVHPQSAVTQGHRVADLKEAHDWAATMDQFAQKKNRDREVMADYITFNAQRLVPTKTDKKTGEQYGAPVMIANNAQDALDKFDWLSKGDVNALQTAMANGNEGSGYKTADGTVVMFLDNLKDANDALLTLSHEIGGHLAAKEGAKEKGLSLVDTVAEVFKGSSRKDTAAYKSERRIGLAEGETKEDATNIAREEALVYSNERRMPYATPLQKAKTAVKLWLKERGMDAKLTDADFDAIAAAGLQRIRMTRTGDTGTQTVDGEGLTPTPTAQGTDLQNRYTYGKWVSDYRQQKDALDAARAATDAAEAARRHADDAAKEQAKIDRMVADEDERQRTLAEQEQMRKDAEHATQYGREMVADVLNGWYGKKGISAEQVNRIVEGATADEIREILDYIDLEMDGKASDGAVLEIAKKVNAAIVKRTVSAKQEAARKAFAERKTKEKEARDAAERKLIEKFVNGVQMNPNSILAFWMNGGRRLLNQPVTMQKTKIGANGKVSGTSVSFKSENGLDAEALTQFFDGMKGDERAKWMRIVFGDDYKPASRDGTSGDANTEPDIVNQRWIAFKRGIEQNDNDSQMSDEDFNDIGAMLDGLRKEYEAYEQWKDGDRLTAEEQRVKDEIDAENARIDAENAAIADAEENWGDAIAMTADGKPVKSIAELNPTDGVPIGGEYLRVVAKDGDVVKLDADDGFGTTWTARFNKENGGWDVETQDTADEGGQDRDRTEDRGDVEQDGSAGREGRDAGAVGGKSGGNGAAAEAPSDYSKVEGLTDAQRKKIAFITKSIGKLKPIVDGNLVRDFHVNDSGDAVFVSVVPGDGFVVNTITEDGDYYSSHYFADGRKEMPNGHPDEKNHIGELIEDGVMSKNTAKEITAEASSADTAQSLTLDGGTAQEIAAEKKRISDQNDIELNEKPLDLSGGPADLSARGEVGKPISASSGSASSDRSSRPGASSSRLSSGGQPFVGRGGNAVAEDNADIIPRAKKDAQGRFRRSAVTPAEDAAYIDAVKRFGKLLDEQSADYERYDELASEIEKKTGEPYARIGMGDVNRFGNDEFAKLHRKLKGVLPNGMDELVSKYGSKIENDAVYYNAVKRGDMETARRMVREAAARAMPETKVVDKDGLPLVVYHSTNRKFNVFNTPSYFASTESDVKGIKGSSVNERIVPVFLDIKSPYELDAEGAKWTSIYVPHEGKSSLNNIVNGMRENGWKWYREDDVITDVDGIIVRNIKEGDIGDVYTDDYIPKSPYQIKSADPVTYDDAGNVIPLSQRFNAEKSDIRWRRSGIYTGSAADYEKPSLLKVGTGEGGQVYGWGLYGSTVRGVAEMYAEQVSRLIPFSSRMRLFYGDEDVTERSTDGIPAILSFVKKNKGSITDAIKDMNDVIKNNPKNIPRYRIDEIEIAKEVLRLNKESFNVRMLGKNIYSQTFFTNRAEGDESHLLNWYDPVSEANLKRIKNRMVAEDISTGGFNPNTGEDAYKQLRYKIAERYGKNGIMSDNEEAKGVSEFLARADIDGIKYPVDSYGGKSVKDGDKVGWNYVSFRDDNITVDHKWVDGKQMFRRRTYTPNLAAQLLAEKRVLSTTDALRELKAAQDGNSALVAAEKLARELAAQGSIDPVLRDLVKATKEGTPVQIAKGNLAALASSQAFSRWREILQDAQISLKEMETKYGIGTDASAYAQFDRNYGLVKDAMDKFYREIYEPLTKELKDNGVKADDFDEYLRAKHGPERNRMIAERSPYVLTALSDKRTQAIVKDILSGARDLDDAAILDISKKLGWVDKNGKRTQESKDFEDDLRGSGATTAHWNNVLAKFAADGLTPKMLGAEELVRELTQRNRDLLVQTGRLSADQAALWEKLSPNYVPLKSDMEMDSNVWTKFLLGGGADKGGTNGKRYSDREYNHAYGRGTIADSPLSFAIQQYEESLNRAYDNVARQRLAAMVRANPNMGKVFRYLSDAERADLAKRIAILNNIAKKRMLTSAELDALKKMRVKLAEANNADKSIPTTKVLGANGIMHEVPTLASIEGTKQSQTAVVAFKEDGELKFIRLGGFAQDDVNKDPRKLDDVTARRIATAVKKQNMAELGEVGKKIRWLTGMFSALRTAYSPTFLVSNLGADNTQAMRNIYATFGGRGAVQFEKYAFHAFKAAAATLSGNYGTTKIMQYAKEWAENGGKIGGLATDQIGDLQKKMARDIRRLYSQTDQLANIHNVKDFVSWANDKRHGFADLVEKYNGIVEMSTRIAAYATARDMGQSVNDAVAYSRDITVNFNRKGTATPWINALYAFSNATMQDIHRSLVAFGEGRTGKGLGILAGRGAKMGFGLMVLGFLSSMLGFWQDDPEDEQEGKAQYKNAKEWQKQNVMGIRIGGKTVGVPIRGLSRIPYYLGHQVYEAMTGRKSVGKMAADTALLAIENATDFLGQASTPLNVLTPSVLRPAVDIGINKTFTGQQMYREPMSNTDVRSEMGRGTTSGAAKWIARALNRMTGGNEGKRGLVDVQPEKVAEVWNWIFGSAGNDIANIAGTAKDVATGDILDRPLKNIPYLSRFIRNLDENSARYYEARDAYDAARKEYKTLVALDRTDDAQKVLDENPWLSERGANKRWGIDLNEVKNFVSKLLELEKGAEGEDYDTIHAMRLKAQYQFMRRMEQAANTDGEGMSAERELKRKAMPFLRASKKAKKDAERESTRAKRSLIPRSTR